MITKRESRVETGEDSRGVQTEEGLSRALAISFIKDETEATASETFK